MSTRILALAATAALVGCKKPPVEAPAEMGELAAFLFANFDNEDPAELIAGIPTIESYMDDHDLTGDIEARTYSLPPLTEADWGGAQGPASADATLQLPVAVFGKSRHGLDPNVALTAETNHVCIESNTTVYYWRAHDTDADAFVGGSEEFLRTTNEVRKESFVAKVWYDLYKDYRIVADEDGREVMFARSWIDQQYLADGGGNSWDQLYTVEVWVPDGEEVKRFYAFWSQVTISGVGDDFYQALVRDGINEGYINADNFVDGTMCANDRDYQPDPRE